MIKCAGRSCYPRFARYNLEQQVTSKICFVVSKKWYKVISRFRGLNDLLTDFVGSYDDQQDLSPCDHACIGYKYEKLGTNFSLTCLLGSIITE